MSQRIALLKPSALGDIVHSLPVLHALRCRFPEAHITWIVNRAFEQLLRGHPDLNETLPFDRRGGFRTIATFARELRSRRFDLVIDLQGLLRTGLMCAATRAPRRIGLSTAREGARWFYSEVVDVCNPDALHAVDRYWLVANALGAGGAPKEFHVPIESAAREWAASVLRFLPRPWLIVAPGSRWATKRWPPEHFAELLRCAHHRYNGTAVFIGSTDEAGLSSNIRARLACPIVDLVGTTTLPQLAAVLSQADVVLANDSGPLHLSAALGRPVVAPYTCTQVRKHGPYGQGGGVESRVWCQGSYRKSCSRLECMTELTPERLWPALDEVLSQWARHSRSA